jgi:hypothetical protein
MGTGVVSGPSSLPNFATVASIQVFTLERLLMSTMEVM